MAFTICERHFPQISLVFVMLSKKGMRNVLQRGNFLNRLHVLTVPYFEESHFFAGLSKDGADTICMFPTCSGMNELNGTGAEDFQKSGK